jgi:hypothetical protein
MTLLLERIVMRSYRLVTGLAMVAVAGAVALAPAVATSGSASAPAVAYAGPVAHASGGDAGSLPYPSIVNVRLVRAQAALDRATALVDENQTAGVAVELSSAVSNMNAAWDAAKYVIETAPPPVAGSGAYGHVSGGAVGGLTFASPEETGFAVLTLQHTVATTALGLVTADPLLWPNVRSTVTAALIARDAAVDYIHLIPVPAAGAGSFHAKTSGAPIAAGWGLLMPNMLSLLDDEIQQLRGTRVLNPTLSSLVLHRIARWRIRIVGEKDTINGYWPPVPAG